MTAKRKPAPTALCVTGEALHMKGKNPHKRRWHLEFDIFLQKSTSKGKMMALLEAATNLIDELVHENGLAEENVVACMGMSHPLGDCDDCEEPKP